MPIYIRIYKTKAVFGYSEDIRWQIHKWMDSVDKKYAEKQRNSDEHPNKPFADDVIKKPHYGAVGGAYEFYFQQAGTTASLKIKNSVTGDSIKFISEKQPSQPKKKEDRCFSIGRSLLQRLKKWEINDKDKTDENNYVYKFCPTTIGDIIKIRNSKTKREIDLTDYDEW